jgi:hypothetical protein
MVDDFTVKVPSALKPQLDAYAQVQGAAQPGVRWNRATAVRALLAEGLAAWERRRARGRRGQGAPAGDGGGAR